MIILDFFPTLPKELVQHTEFLIEPTYFPAGETHLNLPEVLPLYFEHLKIDKLTICWKYKNDGEIFTILALLDRLKELASDHDIELYAPYLPHARMDRIKEAHQVKTLQTVLGLLDASGLDRLVTVDVHNRRAVEDLIQFIGYYNTSKTRYLVKYLIDKKLKRQDNIVFIFPDESAYNRFSKELDGIIENYVIIEKARDFNSGTITGSEIKEVAISKHLNVADLKGIIVDDICSYGGTFNRAINLVSKKLGISDFHLAVTHLEEVYNRGDLIYNPLLKGIVSSNTLDWNHNLAEEDGMFIINTTTQSKE